MPVVSKPVHCSDTAVEDRLRAWVSSIFGAGWFGWWVVTLSLASADFHGHRPTVLIIPRPLWCLMSPDLTPYLHYRFISRRTFCLPKCAHLLRIHPRVSDHISIQHHEPIGSLRIGREHVAPAHADQSLYRTRLDSIAQQLSSEKFRVEPATLVLD